MGSAWSSGSKGDRLGSGPQSARPSQQSSVPASDPPLFLEDVRAEPAGWSEDGFCRSVQRLLGFLPDSKGEVLKQQQRYPVFTPHRPSTLGFILATGDARRGAAIVAVQRFYRRYRLLRMWHEAALPMVELSRSRLESQRELDKIEITVASFRHMLIEGFAANKVGISGELKTVQLRLIANADDEEYYLTWTPSRKRNPRIYLHDIEEVIPVLKEGNRHAPRLAGKVSHRRGLIILCKSHHRGRVILELGSKSERKLLLRGFKCLLEEMNREDPVIDDLGILRKRQPRRQSVADFFEAGEGIPQTAGHEQLRPAKEASDSDAPQELESNNFMKPLTATDTETKSPPLRRLSIEELYRTRFDPPSPTAEMEGNDPVKPYARSPVIRRSSVVMDVRGSL